MNPLLRIRQSSMKPVNRDAWNTVKKLKKPGEKAARQTWTICRVCHQKIARDNLGRHLRRSHGIYL
jgi:hypothetical protein